MPRVRWLPQLQLSREAKMDAWDTHRPVGRTGLCTEVGHRTEGRCVKAAWNGLEKCFMLDMAVRVCWAAWAARTCKETIFQL